MSANDAGRAKLSVRVFGGLSLELGDRPLPTPGGRCGVLLAWLALHPGMQPRSLVAARLWPDVLDESARRSLRTALLDLRRTLDPAVARHVHATRDEIGLWPEEEVFVDARAFVAAVADGELERALSLARGDLLPELDHEWTFAARAEHGRELAGVLARLAADAEQRGDLGVAIEHTHRLVAMDPLAEDPARALIRRLAAAGDRAAALATFERHRDRWHAVLRMTPSAQTRELVAQIRRGEQDAAVPEHRYRLAPDRGFERRAPCRRAC